MDTGEAYDQMRLVSLFMAWKQALGFTLAAELMEPDSVYFFGAAHKEQWTVLSLIGRNPLRFGETEWLPPQAVGDELLDLSPRGSTVSGVLTPPFRVDVNLRD